MSDITMQEPGSLLANEIILYHQLLCQSFFLMFVTYWPYSQILAGKVQQLVLVLTQLQCMIFVYHNIQLFKWMKWWYLWFSPHLIFPGAHHLVVVHLHPCKKCPWTDASIQVSEWDIMLPATSQSFWSSPLAGNFISYISFFLKPIICL